MNITSTQFAIGQVVRHRDFPFRGVVVDVDPEYSSSEEWWQSIPEDERPPRDQPFYHLLAENGSAAYHAYVSEQALLVDDSGEPLHNPEVEEVFGEFRGDHYDVPNSYRN